MTGLLDTLQAALKPAFPAGAQIVISVPNGNGGFTFGLVDAGVALAALLSNPAPANSVLPAITGTAQVGQTLTASNGTWSNSPTGFTYAWKRAGAAIPGATSSTYTLVSADIGSVITVTVTATNASGSASVTSAATSAVIAASAGASAAAVQSVSGISTSGTAFQPLAQGLLIYSNVPMAWVCLYHNGADEGVRAAFGGGQLPVLAPQDAAGGTYTLRAYDAATGGSCFYESPAITIAANPNHVGGTLSFTVNWPGAWKTSASNGGNLTTSDNYITANAPMTDATIYASTSSTIPPDQPGGSSGVIGSRAHVVDTKNTQLYVSNLYVSGTGTVYIWVIATSAVDGTTTRSLLSAIAPITVS